MEQRPAEACLRNIARLAKTGGYLGVSGVDLDVRTKVARDLKWDPVMEMIAEVHEGDPSLTQSWPYSYWGVEPFSTAVRDWAIRYASFFQIGSAHGREQVHRDFSGSPKDFGTADLQEDRTDSVPPTLELSGAPSDV
jgi:hypothetical protein